MWISQKSAEPASQPVSHAHQPQKHDCIIHRSSRLVTITTSATTQTDRLSPKMIPQVSSNATSLTTKERHYAQLAAKLGTLANSFETTKQHLNLAAEQAFYMRKLGLAQAST